MYCLFTGICFPLAEWKDIVTIGAALLAAPGVVFAAIKTWLEMKKGTELKRAEFTLTQHHRLFDDVSLREILDLLEGDQERLASHEMFDAKRRFLVFFEEIALLVNSKYLAESVAYYMFGHYAIKAHNGENFKKGMNYTQKHWGLFMSFAQRAQGYLSRDPTEFSGLRL